MDAAVPMCQRGAELIWKANHSHRGQEWWEDILVLGYWMPRTGNLTR